MKATELKHRIFNNLLTYVSSSDTSGLYKVFIPKGTQKWSMPITTWRIDEDGDAFISMDSPPDRRNATPMGSDNRRALQRVWAGETIHVHAAPFAQSLSISQPGTEPNSWRADRDRWLFIDITFPNGVVYNWSSLIDVDPETPIPTPSPKPNPIDPVLYAKTLELVAQVGLVQSMFNLVNDKPVEFNGRRMSNEEFDKWVTTCNVWPGLIEMVRLAEDD